MPSYSTNTRFGRHHRKTMTDHLISESVFDFLRRSLVLPRLLGFFPFNSQFKLSYVYLVLVLLPLSTLSFFFVMTTSGLKRSEYPWKQSRYLDHVQLFVLYFNGWVCILSFCRVRNHYGAIVRALHHYETKAKTLMEKPKYNLAGVIYTALRCLFIVCRLADILLFDAPKQVPTFWYYTCCNDLSFFISHMTMSPFYSLVTIIHELYVKMNQSVESLYMSMDYMGEKKLQELVILHVELLESSCRLNRIYSFIFFTIIVSAFVLITLNLYFLCYFFMVLREKYPYEWYCLLTITSSVLMWILEVSTLTLICVKVHKKSSNFNNGLYKITLNETYDFLGRNEKIQVIVASKPVINFKACGFLPIDYTLLFTIAAAASKYVVLLVQFGSSSRSKDNKSFPQ